MGGVNSIQVYFGCFDFFKLCKAPYANTRKEEDIHGDCDCATQSDDYCGRSKYINVRRRYD